MAKMLVIGQPVPLFKREADILIREAKGEEVEYEMKESVMEQYS